MIVAKFGGTSVADAPAIRRLVEIVRSRLADRPVVVVSALAKVTDALLTLAALACAGDEAALDGAIAALLERHAATAHALGPAAESAMPPIADDAAALRRELHAALGRPLRPAELDALAGRGEVWSSRLVAGAFAQAGVEAPWVDMRTLMLTDNRFGRATPQMQVFTARATRDSPPLCRCTEWMACKAGDWKRHSGSV